MLPARFIEPGTYQAAIENHHNVYIRMRRQRGRHLAHGFLPVLSREGPARRVHRSWSADVPAATPAPPTLFPTVLQKLS